QMRLQLFEFEDLTWFPNSVREGGTDYLRYLLEATAFYRPIIPLISETLQKINENRIVDLCSGGGGAIKQVYDGLSPDGIEIRLSDKYPNHEAYSYLSQKTG